MKENCFINSRKKRLEIACKQLEKAINKAKDEASREALEIHLKKTQNNLKEYMEEGHDYW